MTSGPVEPTGVASPSPLRSAARHWIVTVLLAAIGLGAGVAYGYTRTDITNAESRVGVGNGGLAAYQIAGFGPASVQLASNYSRYVGLAQFLPVLRQGLGAGADHLISVRASPVPDSNVIRIEVSADQAGVARPAADIVASNLIDQVKAAAGTDTAASVLAQYTKLARQVAQQQAIQARAETAYAKARNAPGASPTGDAATDPVDPAAVAAADAAAAAVVTAQTNAAALTLQRDALKTRYNNLQTAPTSQSLLRRVQSGVVTGTTRRSAVERYGLAGLVAGLIVALALNTARDRRRISDTARADQAAVASAPRTAGPVTSATADPRTS